jgi:hypothetical protein
MIHAQGRSKQRIALLYVTLLSASIALLALFSDQARANMSSAPTCYPSRANCTKCIEAEGPSGRCTKCAYIPGCVRRRDLKTNPTASMCYVLCMRGRGGAMADRAICRVKCKGRS